MLFKKDRRCLNSPLQKQLDRKSTRWCTKLFFVNVILKSENETSHGDICPDMKIISHLHECHYWFFFAFALKDFADERENLVFLNGTAKDQANLLLEAISVSSERLT